AQCQVDDGRPRFPRPQAARGNPDRPDRRHHAPRSGDRRAARAGHGDGAAQHAGEPSGRFPADHPAGLRGRQGCGQPGGEGPRRPLPRADPGREPDQHDGGLLGRDRLYPVRRQSGAQRARHRRDQLSQRGPLAAREELRRRDRHGTRQFNRRPRGRGAAGRRLSRDRRGMRRKRVRRINLAAVIAVATLAGGAAMAQDKPGFRDTPTLPDGERKVHDADRPHPEVVPPGVTPGAPPSDAVVLFDGTSLDAWEPTGQPWQLENGVLTVPAREEGEEASTLVSKQSFGDVQLHIEFRSPSPPQKSSQDRGNSGVWFMERYEVQILDGYDNPTYADGDRKST